MTNPKHHQGWRHAASPLTATALRENLREEEFSRARVHALLPWKEELARFGDELPEQVELRVDQLRFKTFPDFRIARDAMRLAAEAIQERGYEVVYFEDQHAMQYVIRGLRRNPEEGR